MSRGRRGRTAAGLLLWAAAGGCTGEARKPAAGTTDSAGGSGADGAGSGAGGTDGGEGTGGGGDGDDTASPAPVVCPAPTLHLRQHWPVGHEPLVGGWGAAVGDFDGDGQADIVLASRRGARSLRNADGVLSPGPLLVDGSPAPPAQAVAAADLDEDGDLDLFLGTPSGSPDLLLWNDGAFGFTATALPASDGFTGTGSFADLDGDGRLDLFVARRFEADVSLEEITSLAPPGDPSSLYLQAAPGVFTDASDRLPAAVHPAHTQEAAVLDADGDGDLDLYLANDFGPFIVPNLLLENDGHGVFSVDEDCACDLSMYGMAAAVGDATGDGLPDLWITDIGGPKLLASLPDGSFYETARALGADLGADPERLVSWGALVHDLDRDGRSDILTAFGHIAEVQRESIGLLGEGFTWSDDQHDALLLAGPAGFSDVGAALGFDSPENHRALVRIDVDGDGRSELFLAGGPTARLWGVEGGCETGLRLALDAGPGNPHGIGTRVEVAVGPHRWTGWMLPGGIGSSGELVVEAPLMGAAAADRVTLTWPDGSTQEHRDVPAGAHAWAR